MLHKDLLEFLPIGDVREVTQCMAFVIGKKPLPWLSEDLLITFDNRLFILQNETLPTIPKSVQDLIFVLTDLKITNATLWEIRHISVWDTSVQEKLENIATTLFNRLQDIKSFLLEDLSKPVTPKKLKYTANIAALSSLKSFLVGGKWLFPTAKLMTEKINSHYQTFSISGASISQVVNHPDDYSLSTTTAKAILWMIGNPDDVELFRQHLSDTYGNGYLEEMDLLTIV